MIVDKDGPSKIMAVQGDEGTLDKPAAVPRRSQVRYYK